jgi:hypothetical protein
MPEFEVDMDTLVNMEVGGCKRRDFGAAVCMKVEEGSVGGEL